MSSDAADRSEPPGPSRRGEDRLVDAIRARLKDTRLPHVLHGIGDDCSVTRGDEQTVRLCTTDMLVEEIHFRTGDLTAAQLGDKALAVNLSDIAAMGGWPLDAYVSLALPERLGARFVDELYRGIAQRAAACSLAVLGGDTTRSPGPLMISVSVNGAARRDALLLRSAARVGDRLYVSGPLGDAAAGLYALTRGHDDALARPLIERQVAPRARLELGRRLAETGAARAAMDLSDGLSSDLPRLLDASGVSAVVDAERLPISEALRRYCEREGLDPVELALHGGEDYELLVSGDAALGARSDELIEIGEVVARDDVDEAVLRRAGQSGPLAAGGWDPFR